MTMKLPSHDGAENRSAIPPREWIRIAEAVQWSGISKPRLYLLLNKGLIRSTSLRERGQVKGTRLISFTSLRDFLGSRATGGESTEE